MAMDRTLLEGVWTSPIPKAQDTCPNFGKVHHFEFRGAYSNLNVDDLLIQTCECGAIKATPLKELANAPKA